MSNLKTCEDCGAPIIYGQRHDCTLPGINSMVGHYKHKGFPLWKETANPTIKSKSIWACEEDPSQIISKGTNIKLTSIWVWKDYGGMTPSKNIEITTDKDMPLSEALHEVETAALEFIRSEGGKDIRQYFIEAVKASQGAIEFILGT